MVRNEKIMQEQNPAHHLLEMQAYKPSQKKYSEESKIP